MTKPDKPLNLRIDDVPIDAIFDLQDALGVMAKNGVNREAWYAVKAFLASCSDWSTAELGKLSVTEVVDLTRDLKAALKGGQDDAVPPVTGDGSVSTPTESLAVPLGG